eukprot:c4446_g1_i1.p1 GENE.c4446_g1_i1~~c4446_g1_i1.p1  ORF type:complete len:524 (+),score=197.44 c4446_g1_i1:41-1612(+)
MTSITENKKRPRETEEENEKKTKIKDELIDIDDDDDNQAISQPKIQKITSSTECPYLDTIDRKMLDFDFEKVCSVSLLNLNVYACLVCGKYFQGRGPSSHAYNHSIHESHHIFISLQTKRVYCLPENYEVVDTSLDDIKYLLDPVFTPQMVSELDTKLTTFRALDGHDYVPGMIGIDNLKKTGYLGVVVHALVHVPPLRDYFLIESNYKHCKSPLVKRFGELVRKFWNPSNFKGHVSPHELMQIVTVISNGKFKIGNIGDPLDFLSWFLNALHQHLVGADQKTSIIHQTFQGQLEVITETLEKTSEDHLSTTQIRVVSSATSKTPFLFLKMDLPGMPVFQDEKEQNIIPQVAIFNLLSKFDGSTVTPAGELQQKRYKISKLPKYLIVVFQRFEKNNFFVEKNKTIVTFPPKNLDLQKYVTEKVKISVPTTKYDLVASISVEAETQKEDQTSVYIQNKATDIWYHIRDLHVEEIAIQLLPVTEAYIQVYEQKSTTVKKEESTAVKKEESTTVKEESSVKAENSH